MFEHSLPTKFALDVQNFLRARECLVWIATQETSAKTTKYTAAEAAERNGASTTWRTSQKSSTMTVPFRNLKGRKEGEGEHYSQ